MTNDKENQKIWDHYQSFQRKVFIQSAPRFDYLVKIIKKYKRNGVYLDIGIGDGYLLKKMRKNNFECYGIDLAEDSVKKNKEEFKKEGLLIKLKRGNIKNIPFEKNFFDMITASEVLEHIDDKTLSKGISEIKRCLKEGGIFIGTVPADENLQDNMCFCPHCGKSFHRWGHQQSFDKKKLDRLFRKQFKDFEIRKIPSILYNPNILEMLKFKIKYMINHFYPDLFIGNFIIMAKK